VGYHRRRYMYEGGGEPLVLFGFYFCIQRWCAGDNSYSAKPATIWMSPSNGANLHPELML